MRVKVHVLAPLPERKVILAVEDGASVAQLAAQVCAGVLGGVRASDLALEVDGFELLGGRVAEVLEADDVVTVRLKPTSSKRARSSSAAATPASKRVRRSKSRSARPEAVERPEAVPLPESGSSESESSDSSEDDSSSSESESSDASSDSDSDSDSSSSSSSSSSSASSAAPPPPPQPKPQHIPPGEGKSATHERNARRRKARQARKLAEEGGDCAAPAAVVADALPEGGLSTTATPVTPLLPVPRVMANRNKKRGFLKDAGTGLRTVFGGEEAAEAAETVVENAEASASTSAAAPAPAALTAAPAPSASTSAPAPAPAPAAPVPAPATTPAPSLPATPVRVTQPLHPRAPFLPPSERPLPTNVFVSSKQFPFVKDQQRKGRDARASKPQANGHSGGERELPYDVPYDFSQGLPYGDAEGDEGRPAPPAWAKPAKPAANGSASVPGRAPIPSILSPSPAPDASPNTALWDRVDAAFDSLPLYRASATLAPGTLVAWREVAIDFTTFTPEVKLLLGVVRSASRVAVALERVPHPALVNPEEEDAGPVVETFTPQGLEGAGRRVVPADWA
ncbi:hypothetical protein Q8F55_004983 [Vanrija albida]|uniref:Coilin n=1 Tax=Vanrija albida TaxID=181172 RepID=A0ABR3Q0K6_9TREE